MGTPSRATQTRGGTHSKTWPATPPTHTCFVLLGARRFAHTWYARPTDPVGPRTWPTPQQVKEKAVRGEGGPAGRARGTGPSCPHGAPTSHLQPCAGLDKLEATDPGTCAIWYKFCCGAHPLKGHPSASSSLRWSLRGSWARADSSHTEGRQRERQQRPRQTRQAPPSASPHRTPTRGCAPRAAPTRHRGPRLPPPGPVLRLTPRQPRYPA